MEPAEEDRTQELMDGMNALPGLSREDMAEMLEGAVLRHYGTGQHIHHQGDEATKLYVVVDGWTKIYTETRDGGEIVEELIGRGEIFGENAVLAEPGFHAFSAQSLDDSMIIEIPAPAVRKELTGNPAVARALLSILSSKIRALQVRNEHLSVMNAPQRIACLLLRLSGHMTGSGGSFLLPFDKGLAASLLGMTRETFSRALAQLKPEGVTVRGPEFTVDSFGCLSRYACTHCSLQPEDCSGNRCNPLAEARDENQGAAKPPVA